VTAKVSSLRKPLKYTHMYNPDFHVSMPNNTAYIISLNVGMFNLIHYIDLIETALYVLCHELLFSSIFLIVISKLQTEFEAYTYK